MGGTENGPPASQQPFLPTSPPESNRWVCIIYHSFAVEAHFHLSQSSEPLRNSSSLNFFCLYSFKALAPCRYFNFSASEPLEGGKKTSRHKTKALGLFLFFSLSSAYSSLRAPSPPFTPNARPLILRILLASPLPPPR